MTRHGPPRPLAPAGDPWDTMPGVYVIRLVSAFQRVGVDITGTLPAFGLAPEGFRPDTPVDRRRFVAWLGHVLDRFPHRGLGLVYGGAIDTFDLGIVGHTLATAGSFGHAIDTWLAYSHLVRPLLGTALHTQGDSVELRVVEPDPAPYDRTLRTFWLESQVAAWAALIRRAAGPGPVITEVHCAYSDPQLPARYRDVFECPVRFERPETLLRFPRVLLALPLRYSHDQAFRLCEAQCESLREEMVAATSTATEVGRVLQRDLSRPLELDAVADALGTSPRTLRRRLGEEGTSFTDVLSDVRMRSACDYLRTTTTPVGRIATLIGFADETAFSRAFKRTQQLTPREVRSRQDTRTA
jgi:AraC-like DNA-binding protein